MRYMVLWNNFILYALWLSTFSGKKQLAADSRYFQRQSPIGWMWVGQSKYRCKKYSFKNANLFIKY